MNKQDHIIRRFDEVFDLQMGKTPNRKIPSFFGGENVWLSIRDMGAKYLNESNEHITDDAVKASGIKVVKKGTVIMSFKLTVGKCGITSCDLYTNEAILAFNVKKGFSISPVFLYYYLQRYKWQGTNKAVMGLTLNKATISKQIIDIPPLEKQERIVAELDLLSGIIDKKKEQIKAYDQLAQSIFYTMFGDPIDNPKGWETKKLGEECTEIKYGTSQPASENGKYKYLRMCNITYNGSLDLSDVRYIDISDDEVEKYIVRFGDILFNRTNSLDLIGKTCMFDLDEPMIIAGYIIRVRLTKRLNPRYISALFNLPTMKLLLKKMAKGAVNQANINSKELASILIPLPPLSLQQEFAEKVESIERQKALIRQSIDEVQTMFDYTMDKYFG